MDTLEAQKYFEPDPSAEEPPAQPVPPVNRTVPQPPKQVVPPPGQPVVAPIAPEASVTIDPTAPHQPQN